jgi:molybdopterin/thiamine biosynthesis adenylyltransferase
MLHLTRQLDIIPLDVLGAEITIIGAGAIGSWTALSLAKMGFTNLRVFDFDTISVENLNCQFYRHDQVGQNKTDALKEMIKAFTNEPITVYNERFDGSQTLTPITISAVDSMGARAIIWEACKAQYVKWFIDGRMGAENALLYTMSPLNEKDVASYEKTLYSDADANTERCTAKSTMYTANLLAGLICKAVKDLATKQAYPRTAQWGIAHNDFKTWLGQHA